MHDGADLVRVERDRHRDAVLELNVEYVAWVYDAVERDFGIRLAEILGAGVRQYVIATVDELFAWTPPGGSFYLLHIEGRAAGMGGLRDVGGGVAEIKRVYVRPTERGTGRGRTIVQRLIEDARTFGFHTVRLDTAPFMHAARSIYRAEGFVERAPYAGVEVPADLHPRWVFMERTLER